MSKPNNDPIARRDSIFERPPSQSTRSPTSDFVTSPELTAGTATVTSASATADTTKSVSTPVLRPSTTLQPTTTRLSTPPLYDMTDEAGAGSRPRTKTTTPPSATTSTTTSYHHLPDRQVRRLSLLLAGTIQHSRRLRFGAQTPKTLTRGCFASKS